MDLGDLVSNLRNAEIEAEKAVDDAKEKREEKIRKDRAKIDAITDKAKKDVEEEREEALSSARKEIQSQVKSIEKKSAEKELLIRKKSLSNGEAREIALEILKGELKA